MFEILMLLGFFYAGFCYLLPERKTPAQSVKPKQNGYGFPPQTTAPKPHQSGPHPAANEKRHLRAQMPLRNGHRASQGGLCKASRLC